MIAGLNPYPAMKDSGVEWLGEVPAHWTEKRAKYFYREVDERSTTGNEELMSVSHKTGVTTRKKSVTMFMAESNAGHKICSPNDIAINTMWAFMGALGVAQQIGLVSPSYGVYRPIRSNGLSPEYIDRLLRIDGYKAEYMCRSTGINSSRLRLYPDEFLRIPLIRPPLPEQAAIVRFLDHVDRRVRRYVRAKRKLIALLEEQKQAIIHRAVTRGLDPDVSLKPSGVEWLGDVPAHWEVRKLKRLGDVRIGLIYSPGEISGPNGTLVLRASNIRNGEIVSADDVYVSKDVPEHLIVAEGDILICVRSGSRGLVGKSAEIPEKFEGVSYGAFMSLLRSSLNDFLIWVLKSNMFPCVMAQFETSTINQLTQASLRNLDIPVPPMAERTAIAEYLDQKTTNVKIAILRTNREIEFVNEFRTRLIADVVTGKLDVREVVERLPEIDPLDEGEQLDNSDSGVEDTSGAIPEEVRP